MKDRSFFTSLVSSAGAGTSFSSNLRFIVKMLGDRFCLLCSKKYFIIIFSAPHSLLIAVNSPKFKVDLPRAYSASVRELAQIKGRITFMLPI